MSLLGSASDSKPRDRNEKKKTRPEIGRNAAEEGLRNGRRAARRQPR
jgi:hypothetical protein